MARIAKARGGGSLQRRPGRRPPRSLTLIVCEGQTEQDYFDAARIHYRLTNAEVVIVENTVGSAPISVVECAEHKSKEPGSYDKIFCVFDRDSHASFDEARGKIKSLAGRTKRPLPIEEVVSIPCFEVWVLLHFERKDAPFADCHDVVRCLRDRHMPGYDKADAAVARQLIRSANAALANADWLEPRAAHNDYNPYTQVHRVLRHFESVSRQEAP
ncbi:RloB family protein [Acidiferrobacter sp.]|uniref:RloB family protein n=1 Tax=Acidiferrobacter sp. TaxID=1872107 RepID=UPI0026287486|nr:RloB family protein [Acidiferrobacter sp.]